MKGDRTSFVLDVYFSIKFFVFVSILIFFVIFLRIKLIKMDVCVTMGVSGGVIMMIDIVFEFLYCPHLRSLLDLFHCFALFVRFLNSIRAKKKKKILSLFFLVRFVSQIFSLFISCQSETIQKMDSILSSEIRKEKKN